MKTIIKTVLVASLSIAAAFGSSAVLANSVNENRADAIKASELEPVQQTKVNDDPILGEQACEDYPLC